MMPAATGGPARSADPGGAWAARGFAAGAHANQRRKGAAPEPCVNHPIDKPFVGAAAADGGDAALVIAHLHDVVEDAGLSPATLAAGCGAEAARRIRVQTIPARDAGAAVAQLDAIASRPVPPLDLAKTGREPIAQPAPAIDRLWARIARDFPSPVVEATEGNRERSRRPLLVARLRTDATAAVVAPAPRVAPDFLQRLSGIETDGRDLRIGAHDTG